MGTTQCFGTSPTWLTLTLLFLVSTANVDGKTFYGSNSRSSNTSSHSGRIHGSNHELTKLSYSGTHSQPINHGTNTHSYQQSATVKPIGWNVPNQQHGSNTNNYRPGMNSTIGAGFHTPITPTNVGQGVQSSYPRQHGNTTFYNPRVNSTVDGGFHTPITPTNVGQGVQSSNPRQHGNTTFYNPRVNSTVGTGVHTPITSINAGQGVQSSYPRQPGSIPPGATYYPPGSIPPGATYHPPGSIPPGATYHPTGSLPPGATYHPTGSLPPGAVYHPPGSIPPGAIYYPTGYQPPAGGAPLGPQTPPGTVYYPQPPKTSSGPGLGTGLIVGGLAGGLLGHALTPTGTVVHESKPSNGHSSSSSGDDKIIIINNGPPGSVTTTSAGQGTTVINTGVAAPQPQPPQVVFQPNQQYVPQPGQQYILPQPIANIPAGTPGFAPNPALAPLYPMNNTPSGGVAPAPFPSSGKPFVIPPGYVALAPWNPSSPPDLMRIPGEPLVSGSPSLAMGKHFHTFALSSLVTLIVAFCLH